MSERTDGGEWMIRTKKTTTHPPRSETRVTASAQPTALSRRQEDDGIPGGIAEDALDRLWPSKAPRPAWVAFALFGGALVFGSLASVADPSRIGMRLALILLLALGLCYAGVVALAVRIASRTRTLRPTLEMFLALSPSEFEEVVGALLARSGYADVRHVGGPGDLAADLLCRDGRGRRIVVQCKRYAPGQRVGSPVVQTFIGMVAVYHRAQSGIIVTTSGYTAPARDLAREYDFLLIDGPALVKLAEDVLD